MATTETEAIEPAGDRYAAAKPWRDDVFAMLKGMRAEGLLPKGMTEQAAFLVVTRGRELGMQPIEALSSLYVVNGRVALEGEAMLAAINRNNLGTYLVTESSVERAEVEMVNRSGSKFTAVFTAEDAKRAKLSSDPWQKYPQMMLLWRAVSWGCRVCFPELFNGIYTREEAESMEPIPVAHTVTETTPPAAEPAPRFLALEDILAMKEAANVPASVLEDVIAGMGFTRDRVPTKLGEVLAEKLRVAGERLRTEAQAAEATEVAPYAAPAPKRDVEIADASAAEPPDNPLADEEAGGDAWAAYHQAVEDAKENAKPEDGRLV